MKKQAEKNGDFDQLTANIMRNKFYSKASDKSGQVSASLLNQKREAPQSPESVEANAIRRKIQTKQPDMAINTRPKLLKHSPSERAEKSVGVYKLGGNAPQ